MHALWDSLKIATLTVTEGQTSRSYPARPLYQRSLHVIQEPALPLLHGTLLMSIWPPRVVADARKHHLPLRASQVRQVQYVDLYWLARALTHTTEKYTGDARCELVRLSEVEALFFHLNSLITSLRKDNLADLIGEIKRCVAHTLHTLTPLVVIPEKEEARDLVLKIDEVYDSLQRVNPSALLARLVAARRRVAMRQDSVQDIALEYTARRQAVLLVTSFLEAQVRIAHDFLTRLLSRWDLNVSLHPRLISEQLRQSASVYRTFTIRPFLETFAYVADEYDRAAYEIEYKRTQTARLLLTTALASFQLRVLRVELERTIFTVSRALHTKQRFDGTATLRAIDTTVDQLQAIDCSQMRGFSLSTTIAGLQSARAFFQQSLNQETAQRQGYEGLRQIATTI